MLANITHIPFYSARCGCTARSVPDVLRDGGKTLGEKTAVVSMKQLLEAGVHFGHQTRRRNPKMAEYNPPLQVHCTAKEDC